MMSANSTTTKYRHEYYQNDEYVILTIYIKGVNASSPSLEVVISPQHLFISIPIPSTEQGNTSNNANDNGNNASSTYQMDIDLFARVVPDSSSYMVGKTKVEVKLRKERVGIKWADLERPENEPLVPVPMSTAGEPSTSIPSTTPAAEKAPSYPTSSKRGPKNWDAIEKGVEEEKPEGEAALNALFRQIYQNADENTKRAMNKSFIESGGTVLSTNWNEVGQKKVEITPPDGMEVKKWEA